MIQIEHLTKTYDTATSTEHHALQDINLSIDEGDIYGIIGASGAGKSTLIRCINLLERPSAGRILIEGNDVTKSSRKELLGLRSNIGMIFQSFSLFQQRTALKNVTFPLELLGVNKKEREAYASELLELVGIADKAKAYPSQLSGGQQQRVAIARALANKPHIMLCDEATSALDTRTTVSILNLLKDINARLKVTMVIITHSLLVADRICNKVAVIDEGRIVESGKTDAVFANPQTTVTKEILKNDTLHSAVLPAEPPAAPPTEPPADPTSEPAKLAARPTKPIKSA
jgi:D-methionine transport system ATP-binding protein